MIIIYSEYWRYNPNYGKALGLFQYYDVLIMVLALGALISWHLKKPRKKPTSYINGLSIFGGILLLDAIVLNRFCAKVSAIDFKTSGLFSHLGHIIGVAICIFLVYLVVRLLGELLTTIFPVKVSHQDLPLIRVSLGVMTFTSLLFFLGLIGLLNGFVIIPICFLLMIFYWRHSFQIIKKTLITPIAIPKNLSVVGVFSFLFLALFVILNFVQILRPFPIGSDSLRLYVNVPTLIAEYGALVDGFQPYNWSLFMSTGLTVFGRTDVVLGLSFLGGILSLWALFRLSRKWVDVNYSALVLLLFYSIPMVSFLSYMDMKIDMALMFVCISILLLYYNWIVPNDNEIAVKNTKGPGLMKAHSFFKNRIPPILKKNRIPILIGLLSGFAFGIKLTILFFFLALLSTIWFFKGGRLAFIASFFLCFAAIFILQLDAHPGLRQFHDSVDNLQWVLLSIGLGPLVYMFIKQRQKLVELFTYSLIIGSFFALPILPWLGKNFSETKQINVTSLLNGKKASPIFQMDKSKTPSKKEIIIPGVYQLPEVAPKKDDNTNIKKNSDTDNNKNKKKNNKKQSIHSEDLHRFMGYEVTPAKYLSLPYDVFIKTNISGFFTDVGFLLLLLFPIVYLLGGRNKLDWKTVVANLSFFVLSALLLIISVPSAYLNQNKLVGTGEGLKLLKANESSGFLGAISDTTNGVLLDIYEPLNNWFLSVTSGGDWITYPFLIALFLALIALIYNRVKNHSKATQSVVLFLLLYAFLWWVLGSGAPWYGILLFSLPFIFLFKSMSTQQDKENEEHRKFDLEGSVKKYALLSLSMIWVLLAFVHRSSNYEPVDNNRVKNIFYPAIMDYQMGNLDEKKVMDYHFPNVRQQVKIINRDKKSKIYMVGSPFNFFIDKNDSRVLSDTYLEFFSQLISHYKTKDQIIRKLKEEGFKYIIFDLNMFSYDKTPDKSLTRKFVQFLNTFYNNPGVEQMVTDRKIKLYDSGKEVFDVFQDKGDITMNGTFGIFKIK
ncbi:MAG: hypothetical protein AAGA77_12565 [Bacteroidota bacterium]